MCSRQVPRTASAPRQGAELFTQRYDGYKVQAVINWINGHRHDGSGKPGTPAIFGMNFQTVSTAQKLPTSRTEGNLREPPQAAASPMARLPGRS
jgi:hypothetical protein